MATIRYHRWSLMTPMRPPATRQANSSTNLFTAFHNSLGFPAASWFEEDLVSFAYHILGGIRGANGSSCLATVWELMHIGTRCACARYTVAVAMASLHMEPPRRSNFFRAANRKDSWKKALEVLITRLGNNARNRNLSTKSTEDHLTIFHQNIQCLRNKIHEMNRKFG